MRDEQRLENIYFFLDIYKGILFTRNFCLVLIIKGRKSSEYLYMAC